MNDSRQLEFKVTFTHKCLVTCAKLLNQPMLLTWITHVCIDSHIYTQKSAQLAKARYTLATDGCRYGRLCFGNKSATTWIRQLVVVDTVTNSIKFVADTVDSVAQMSNVLSTLTLVCMGLSTKSTVLTLVCMGLSTKSTVLTLVCMGLSTKSTVLNSTLSPVVTALYKQGLF